MIKIAHHSAVLKIDQQQCHKSEGWLQSDVLRDLLHLHILSYGHILLLDSSFEENDIMTKKLLNTDASSKLFKCTKYHAQQQH